MIRNFKPSDNPIKAMKVNVYRKDGKYWLGKDLLPNPYSDAGMYSFWEEESVIITIPMNDIEHIESYIEFIPT